MTVIRALFEQILNMLEGLGPFGPLAFIPIYIIGTVLFIPTPVLSLAAGVLFTVPMGFVLTSVSSVVSEAGFFLAGRNLSRGWVLKKVASNKKVQAIYDTVAQRGWKMVLLLRLSSVLPFSVVNYVLGLSKISFKHYILASWIGMIPGMLLYVYLGSFLGRIVFQAGQRQKTPGEWIFSALGLTVTLGITIYASSIVKKTLRTHVTK